MRNVLRTVTGAGAVALIVYGIVQPIDRDGDGRWLICLWIAALLIGVAVWMSLPQTPRSLNRNVQHLGLIVAIGFTLLSMQLLRQQVVKATPIYNRSVTDPESGQITSNVRPVLESQKIQRGEIFDADGTVLVSSEVQQDGFVWRTYPLTAQFSAEAFSHVVGFFSHRFGQSGLEATYNDYLTGERGSELRQISDDLLDRPRRGNSLHLTLNAQLQQRAFELLGERTGSVVVLEPQTGKVLALVSTPGFDSGRLSFNPGAPDRTAENARISQYWENLNSDAAGQPLINRVTQGQYPPGSSYKTVTAIGVLSDPAKGRPDDISCPDQFFPEPDSPPVVNAVRQGLEGLIRSQGEPRLESVYAFSCNTAFAQYALRLGADGMTNVAGQLDIYRPQDTPDVYEGFTDLLTTPSRLFVNPGFLQRPSALADTGYGQGELLVTPMQMAMITAAIGNDGLLMRPYLVESVTDPDNTTIMHQQPQRIRRAMSSQVAETMRRNMRAGVAYGFGRAADAVPGVAVGGKSGTAQFGTEGRTHAWFIALAPYDTPRFAVCVMVEGGGEGSTVGAELAGKVLAAAYQIVK